LAFFNDLPALQAIRTGQRLNPIPNLQGPIDIGFGAGVLPHPSTIVSDFMALPTAQQRDDVLVAYEIAGFPRETVLAMMAAATPGLRVPQTRFSFV
jgi:hypothetical protein